MAADRVPSDRWLWEVEILSEQAGEIAKRKLTHAAFRAGAQALLQHVGIEFKDKNFKLDRERAQGKMIVHEQSPPLTLRDSKVMTLGRVTTKNFYWLDTVQKSSEYYVRQMTGDEADTSADPRQGVAWLPKPGPEVPANWIEVLSFGHRLAQLAEAAEFELPTYRFHHEVPQPELAFFPDSAVA